MEDNSAAAGAGSFAGQQEAWTVIGDDPANLHVVETARPHMRICFLTSDGPTERRARLIAAAPDLLAAAQKLLASLHAHIDSAPKNAVPLFDGIAELHGAITKAEGGAPESAPAPAEERTP